MEIFKLFVTLTGVVMSLGYYPQAYNIWKSKSSENISIPTYIIFSLGTVIWSIYGIVINDMTIVISFTIGVIGSWSVLFFALKYRKGKI